MDHAVAVTPDRLDRRALNRALLARQGLLSRTAMGTTEALEHLVGLQGQAPDAPYVGLWSRLEGFDPAELAGLIASRGAVRVPLMRGTVHLVTAADALALRPLVQVVLERGFFGQAFGHAVAGMDMDDLLGFGRALLAEQPRTRAALAPLLAERWPDRDPTAMAYAVSYLVPVVQVPPRGVWGSRGPAALAPLEEWLGRGLEPAPSLDAVVLRYLAAFGPATVADVQAWSGLTRLREVTDRLAPRPRSFRDEAGRDLLDLPDAPRPGADVPAPPRFLPEYDNVLLSHADRARVMDAGRRPPLPPGNGATMGTVLVDGFMRATWRVRRDRGAATLTVEPFERLSATDATGVAEEGERLLRFVAPDERYDVAITAPA